MMILACSGNDNIAQNPFYEYLTQHSVFESLVHILCQTPGKIKVFQMMITKISLIYLSPMTRAFGTWTGCCSDSYSHGLLPQNW